ncbi:UNVERIFIED_CONTAM: Allene oxide synthase 1, chloroplastic [Sesamum radiatum]|uniref:Allene oxide synthase 1, chloroplastic n=1 Tax=Sesamum radiatum TaxID=300843 RepID=A0AAW2QE65_SESRA
MVAKGVRSLPIIQPPYRRNRTFLNHHLTAAVAPEKPSKLPVRKVPGDYGLPLIGPWKDRQDYFYNQGRDEFFKSRIQKYQSTVFRTNMPPGPSFPSTRTS